MDEIAGHRATTRFWFLVVIIWLLLLTYFVCKYKCPVINEMEKIDKTLESYRNISEG